MTKIEWTQRPGTKGETWNLIKAMNNVTGGIGHFCVKVSEGCRKCYAADFQKRFNNPVRYAVQDANQVYIYISDRQMWKPLHWTKPRTSFVCSMTDVFYEGHDDKWIDHVFTVAALCPQHTIIILTKRPHRMRDYMRRIDDKGRHPAMAYAALLAATGRYSTPALDLRQWPLPNVWLGVSVEDQPTADKRIPILLNTPTKLRFISAEPLLGPIDLARWTTDGADFLRYCDAVGGPQPNIDMLDWVICGGESGHKANPMHPDWARSLRDQCSAANVPFFFKQWGNTAPLLDSEPVFTATHHLVAWPDGTVGPGQAKDKGGPGLQLYRTTKKAAGRELDGMQHNTWPRAAS